MTIRLLHQYLHFAPGSTVDGFGKGVALELIRRGIAEEVVDAKAVQAPPANKALTPASVKRKGVR